MNRVPDHPQKASPPPHDLDAAKLPYVIEVVGPAQGEATVLARLETLSLAEATYEAAQAEQPDASIVLRQGDRVLRASAAAAAGR
ncbi:hypothetical protein [Phenylobacterium sp.]|jgi:hypothetical protein|uniref:hypothetical protein n=1 Tax=Phenylobacterium sp. TaxID=1871053 RepID=UPI002F941794